MASAAILDPRSSIFYLRSRHCPLTSVSFKIAVKKNPTVLLAILLVAHMGAVSLNRVPGKSDQRFARVWLMAVLAPFQSVTTIVVSTVSNTWHHYFRLRDATLENERLRTEHAQMRAELIRIKEDLKQVEQLRAFTHRPPLPGYQQVAAQVIARDAIQWFNSVVIDRGTLHGIEKDQPVVTSEGLVGRVIDVSPLASRVLLITDERHSAGAIIGQLEQARVLGVVKGRSNYLCEMKFVAGTEKVEIGDTVITSGQDRLYPKGLIIGRVTRVETGSPTTPFVIEVEPAAPLTKLDLVSVLLTPKDSRAPVTELLNQEKEKPVRPRGKK
jgi:rod shape-determining protein MreC